MTVAILVVPSVTKLPPEADGAVVVGGSHAALYAAHVIANQYRSARRRHNLDMRLAHETGVVVTGADPAESLGRRDAFSVAFALLDEPEREVLRLIAWDGLDTRDAARVFGCSPGSVLSLPSRLVPRRLITAARSARP